MVNNIVKLINFYFVDSVKTEIQKPQLMNFTDTSMYILQLHQHIHFFLLCSCFSVPLSLFPFFVVLG